MDRASFVTASEIALQLASTPEVREAWDEESACAGMTVGGLAHHLLQQIAHAADLLAAAPGEDEPITLLEHYRRAAWVKAGPDDEVNVAIREGADEAAAGGPDAVLAGATEALTRLPASLRTAREPDEVLIPWQGWALTSDDFLVTRAMEIVVHADDLAASVDLPTPEFPADLVADVLALLTGVAVRRHGQTAVVRALSRPQRTAGPVSAF